MATRTPDIGPSDEDEISWRQYATCIITPMTDEDGRPIVKPVHLLDAAIVASIVFFSTLLGDIVASIYMGDAAYISWREMMVRTPTGIIAFGLTFFAQWAKYRGIKLFEFFGGGIE